jgi:hypothetical protein
VAECLSDLDSHLDSDSDSAAMKPAVKGASAALSWVTAPRELEKMNQAEGKGSLLGMYLTVLIHFDSSRRVV